MFGFSLLDLALILWLLGQLIYGLSVGLVVSLGGVVGFAAGAVAAFFAAPLASQYAPSAGWRTAFVIGATVILIALGHALGVRLGRFIGGAVRFGPVRAVNRLLGGALSLAVGALMISLVAFSVSNLGIPFISQALSNSVVVTTIDKWTPDPVKTAAAQVRSLVLDEGIPQLLNPQGVNASVAPPNTSTNTAAWTTASQSVLKITGTAFQCGQNQTGSGFVVSPGRVVTNAHVVAGVANPMVQTANQGFMPAKVVYFDPHKDLAVLAVSGLNTPALSVGRDLSIGQNGAFAGYPLGGPLQVRPATVRSEGPTIVPDIYGQDPSTEQVYQLAGNVQPGNSGGPLLNADGQVTGVVFAKSTSSAPVGFAFTMAQVGPVIQAAPMLNSAVSTGPCTKE